MADDLVSADGTVSQDVDGASHTALDSRSSAAHEPRSSSRPLSGVNVLVMTSGHEVNDSRVYARHACGLQRLGATVTLVGKLEKGRVGDVRTLTIRPASSRPARFLGQPWRCLWAARRETPDIVHFHDAEMLTVLLVAKLRWPRARFVYDVHEDFANLLLVRDWLPVWARQPLRLLTDTSEKVAALLADAIVAVTGPLEDRFWNRRKISAYNFVSRDFLDEAARSSRPPRLREFDLVHLGTLSAARAAFLGETIRTLHELRPNARSLVIGVSPHDESILEPVVPAGCTLLGRRPYDEIASLLGNAKVGLDVHPVLGRHLRVALPVKVCEYMAAGCAVVSSAMPVLSRILADSGADESMITIIEGGEPDDYARAIAQRLEAIEAGADPGTRLRELASRSMTWEGELEKIARLYLELLGRPCAA